MRVKVWLLLLLMPLPITTAPEPTTASPLRIVELLANPDPALLQREFIELLNTGTAVVELAGWNVRDAGTNNFTFQTWTLAPGARVVVWSNSSGNAYGPSWSASEGKTVWNDGGDAATLRAPDGAIVDYFAYGSTTSTAPPGFESGAWPAAAPRGTALRWMNGTWGQAEPSPGHALPGQGGAAAADVQNVAPRLVVDGLPASARPGTNVRFAVEIHDDNGDADVASWTVSAAGTVFAKGASAGRHNVTVSAPASTGTWALTIVAHDQTGATSYANQTVSIRSSALQLSLPPSGALRFPALRPGDVNVTSLDQFTLRNDGEDVLQPVFDLSSFRGGSASFAAVGNAFVGLRSGDVTQWIPYNLQLLDLPSLAPGASWNVTLRIAAVPIPLPAGSYGTSFTVVA